MKTENLLITIQTVYNQFTNAEKKIADYVLLNYDKVVFMSITDLSDDCKVADASVFRFCRTMGLKGYQEFKMKLSLTINNDQANEILNASGSELTDGMCLAENIMNNSINALKETYMLLKKSQVIETVELMNNARNVYFFGVGDSLLTAQEARNKFLRITNKVQCISDPHMQAMAAAMTTSEDVIIFISYSGATKDNVMVAEIARKNGTKIVAITRFVKSPLTMYTDAILLCGSNEGPLEGGAMSSKVSQMFLIDILLHEYYKKNKEQSTINNQNTTSAVVEKLY